MKNSPYKLSTEEESKLTNELTVYANEGASDDELRQFRDAYIGELKKKGETLPQGSSQPAAQGIQPTVPSGGGVDNTPEGQKKARLQELDTKLKSIVNKGIADGWTARQTQLYTKDIQDEIETVLGSDIYDNNTQPELSREVSILQPSSTIVKKEQDPKKKFEQEAAAPQAKAAKFNAYSGDRTKDIPQNIARADSKAITPLVTLDYLDYKAEVHPELGVVEREKYNALKTKKDLTATDEEFIRDIEAEAISTKFEGEKQKRWFLENEIKDLEAIPQEALTQEQIDSKALLYAQYGKLTENMRSLSEMNQMNPDEYAQIKKREPETEAKKVSRFENLQDGNGKFKEATGAVVGAVGSGIVSIAQVPKIMGDLLGDKDYDWADELYDYVQDVKDNREAAYGAPLPMGKSMSDLPLTARLAVVGGSAVGSVALFAAGGSLGGASKAGQSAATFGTAFLTSEAGYYEEAKAAGMSNQEAAASATYLATATAAIETIIPDIKYFEPSAFRKSVIRELTSGKPAKEAIKAAIKALPETGAAILKPAIKETGEEILGQVTEDFSKESLNAIGEKEYFKETFEADNYVDAMIGGFLSGGGMSVFSRPQTKVQEEVLMEGAENADSIVSYMETTSSPNVEGAKKALETAKQSLDALKSHSNWSSLSTEEQNHALALTQQAAAIEEEQKKIGAVRLQDAAKDEQIKAIEDELNAMFSAKPLNENKESKTDDVKAVENDILPDKVGDVVAPSEGGASAELQGDVSKEGSKVETDAVDTEVNLNEVSETPTASGIESTAKIQNFTQFAKENGYPDDYDTSFQAQLLGGRGLEGQRQSNRSIKEQDDAFQEMQNKKAKGKKAYEQAILGGKVIDPDGKLTREGILKRDYDFAKKELESKIANAESGIKNIEGLGKMAHLDNGKLKKGYQRAVDDYNETISKHKETIDKLKSEYETAKSESLLSKEQTPTASGIESTAKGTRRGEKQFARAFQELNEAKTAEQKLNAIAKIKINENAGGVLTDAEKQQMTEVENGLKEEGYEAPNLYGVKFNEGMKLTVENAKSDDTLADGETVITRVLVPQINKDGKMIQPAKVEVTVGTKEGGLTRQEWLAEKQKKSESLLSTPETKEGNPVLRDVNSNADYNKIDSELYNKWKDLNGKVSKMDKSSPEYSTAKKELEAADRALTDFRNNNKDLILEHGTPHDFDKFQLEKIGTGEGNQAFGWGLYFTESNKIAKQYAEKLSKDKEGNVYKVTLKDGRVKDWLEWRDALDDTQAEKITQVVASKKAEYEKYLSETENDKSHTGAAESLFNEDLDIDERPLQAGAVYSDLADAFGQKEATRIMVEAGIDGVRYKSNAGKGEAYNYVVFNPESIKITEKNKSESLLSKEQHQEGSSTEKPNNSKSPKSQSILLQNDKESKGEGLLKGGDNDKINSLIAKKNRYNALPKSKKSTQGNNILAEIKKEAKALGLDVRNVLSGISITDKNGKKIAKRGIVREKNETVQDEKTAIKWASTGEGGLRNAIMAMVLGNKVNSKDSELGSGSNEQKSASRNGLIDRKNSGVSIDILANEILPEMGAFVRDEQDAINEIQDVLSSYETKQQIIDDLVEAHKKVTSDIDEYYKWKEENGIDEDGDSVIESFVNDLEQPEIDRLAKEWDNHWESLSDIEKKQITNEYEQATNQQQFSEGVESGTNIEGKTTPKEESKPLTRAEKARKLADELDAATGKSAMMLPKAIAGALRIYADILDKGGETIENIRKAINAARDYFTNSDEYKALSQEDKVIADEEFAEMVGEEETEPKVETASAAETKERKFVTSVKAASDISDDVKDAFDEDRIKYEVLPNDVSVKEANAIIEAVGLDKAKEMVLTPSVKMPSAFRVTVAQILIKKFNEVGRLSDSVDVVEGIAEIATDYGQGIQALSLFKFLTPEGQLLAAQRDIANQRTKKFKTHKKKIDKIKKAVKTANKESADETVKNISGRIDETVVSTPPKVKRPPSYGANNKVVSKSAYEKARAALKTKMFSTVVPPPELVTIAAYHIEAGSRSFASFSKRMIEDFGGKVKDYLKGAYEAAQEQVGGDGYSTTEEIDQHIEKEFQRDVRAGLKDLNIKIQDIVRKHYSELDAAKESLVDKLVSEAGLEGAEAARLAEIVQKEFDRIATKKKEEALNRIFKFDRKKPNIKTLQQKIIEQSNLGAFDKAALDEMYAEHLGFPKLTDENVKKITELANKVQQAEEGRFKDRAAEDLLKYREQIKGYSMLDAVQSVWMANILSGPKTQFVNIFANVANSVALLSNAILQNPKATRLIVKGMAVGLKRGFFEGIDVMRTGYGPIRGKVEIPTVLERMEFKGGKLNPANYAKYVRRFMLAADTFSFEGLRQMRAFQMAYKQAAQEFETTPSLSKYNRTLEILNRTDGAVEQAIADATAEMEETIKNIETSEATAKEKVEAINQAKIDRRFRIHEFLEKNRDHSIESESHEYAARGTFNYKPEGFLGVLSDSMNNLLRRIPAARYVVPFVNVISNVANETINYTPLGAVRAYKEGGTITGINQKENITDQQRKDLYVKAAMGTFVMGVAYLLTQIGDDDDEPLLEVTTNGYGDFGKNADLAASGWQPYSFRVKTKDGYGPWISYRYTPFVWGLSIIGNANDFERYRKEKPSDNGWSKVGVIATGGIRTLTESTFLSSGENFLSALLDSKDENLSDNMAQWANKTATSTIVPNLYTQSAQQIEAWANVPQKEIRDTYMGRLLRDAPVARDKYSNKVNGLGEELPTDTDIFVSIGQSKENDNLWDLLADKKATTSPPARSITFVDNSNIERAMTDEEFYKFSKRRGELLKIYLISNYNTIKDLSSADFNAAFTSQKSSATTTAKAELTGGSSGGM
jgi:ADP-Ribosyltransferase in polyvalent proteins